MLVLIVAAVAGLLAGYALGGRLRNLDHLSLRAPWLVLLALAVQLVIFTRLGNGFGESASLVAHIASYGLLLVFVALNLRRASLVLVGAGTLLNAVVIVANGGYMPASQRALEVAGILQTSTHNNSMVARDGARLLPLGDVMAVPGGLSVLSNVFSVGDLLIAVGVAALLATAMRAPITASGVHTARQS